MKIVTNNLKLVQKVWTTVRNTGILPYQYVYIDFDNDTIKFMNEQCYVKAQLVLVDKENHTPMFIEGAKFFSLVNSYEFLTVDGDSFISQDGNKFVLPALSNDMEFPDFSFDDWESKTVDFSDSLKIILSASQEYIDKQESSFSTLFFQDGVGIALNKRRMFFAETHDAACTGFNFPLDVIRVITALGIEGQVELQTRTATNGSCMIQFEVEGILFRYTTSSEYKLPVDPFSDKFMSSFYHDNCFYFERNKLNEAVKFISDYFKGFKDIVCKSVFHTLDEAGAPLAEPYLQITLKYQGELNYKVPLISVTDPAYFDGKIVSFYIDTYKSIISTLGAYGVEMIKARFQQGKPGIMFTDGADGAEESRIYLVHIIVEEV